MESATKVKLDQGQLTAIIRHAFGENREVLSVSENTDGWFNALYILNVSGMNDVFLKVAPPDDTPCLRYERSIIKTETAVLKRFGNHKTIPAPRVLAEDHSRRIIDSDYFLMEKLDGTSYGSLKGSLDDGARSRLNREKGRINREINSIKGTSYGLYSPDRMKFSTWKEAFLSLADDILDDAVDFGAALPLPADRFKEIFREKSPCLDSVGEPSLVHWDLHDGNVLVGDDKRISGIIDCDRALWGDPAMEYYFTGLFPEGDDFHEGYGTDLRQEPGFDLRRALYDLYLTLIFVTECQSRKIEDKGHLDWAASMLGKQMGIMGI